MPAARRIVWALLARLPARWQPTSIQRHHRPRRPLPATVSPAGMRGWRAPSRIGGMVAPAARLSRSLRFLALAYGSVTALAVRREIAGTSGKGQDRPAHRADPQAERRNTQPLDHAGMSVTPLASAGVVPLAMATPDRQPGATRARRLLSTPKRLEAEVHLEPGDLWAQVPELGGCFAHGHTYDELVHRRLGEAIAMCITEDQDAEPHDIADASGDRAAELPRLLIRGCRDAAPGWTRQPAR